MGRRKRGEASYLSCVSFADDARDNAVSLLYDVESLSGIVDRGLVL
jgi:hypothetical protein